ncbi:MAG: transcription elongation factor GreA, partial [Nitrospirota bacterium]
MKVPITKDGYEKLRTELERLKKIERSKIIKEIAEARAHGDLSENAEYHAAKEKQSFVEGKIKDMEAKLADATIIDTRNLSTEKIVFGATVVISDTQSGEKKRYTLVGQDESDLKEGKISVQSPVGRALIGHKVGDLVEITTPAA